MENDEYVGAILDLASLGTRGALGRFVDQASNIYNSGGDPVAVSVASSVLGQMVPNFAPNTGSGIYNANGDPVLRSTRRPAFDNMKENGIEVGGNNFSLSNHAYNSLFKSGRKDIMPADVKDALKQQPRVT